MWNNPIRSSFTKHFKSFPQKILIFDKYDEIEVESINENNTQLNEIYHNPLNIFIFLILYSIWFGGFTKQQLYDYLNKN